MTAKLSSHAQGRPTALLMYSLTMSEGNFLGISDHQMQHWQHENKLVLVTSLITCSVVVLGILFYALFGYQIIEAMYAGRSLEFLNKLIAQHRIGRPYATLDHYFTLSKLLLSRIILTCLVVLLLFIVIVKYCEVLYLIRSFFA